ncbi:hypothetical protein [Parahaliea aestuarii]|uniref:EexN family lipoprotein n=1 Tax=Parahaliea aestuarii TaxID=1852021 RepID=A0A5C8ZUN5_9GAMM|nr:hypothetical protein [Parahaliea aestuarii]TXS92235.1 hypothetical protein FVW59_07350 [Parahaliea aestuarii]
MKSRLIPTLVLSAAFGTLLGCASTETSTQNTVASNSVAEDSAAPGGLRCKSVIKTGTRLRSKVCKTEAEWEQAAQDSRTATSDIQRTATHGPGPAGG